MIDGEPVRAVTVFVSLYLVLSLPPFLFFNPDLSPGVRQTAMVATVGTAGLVMIAGLFLAREGVDRYIQFLVAPSDLLSAVVDLSFVIAAISWWAVPELAFYLAVDPTLELLFGGIVVAHVPMVLFLSLMTAIGKVETR